MKKNMRKTVVTGMAVRSYRVEGPILKDVHTMAQLIKRSLLDVRKNYNFGGNIVRKPVFQSSLSELGCPASILKTYGDLVISIQPGESRALGLYYPTLGKIVITYSPSSVDDTVTDFRSALRGFDLVIEHELRHFCDHRLGIHDLGKKDENPDSGSFKEYYNKEHEIDARLTSLFVRVDTLFRGSAIMALKGKIDALSKEHHNLLKGSFDSFLSWLYKKDRETGINAITISCLTPWTTGQIEGKSNEFWKFLIEEYGMALRVTKKEEVTPDQKRAWVNLMNSTKDKNQHKEQLAKIAGA